MRLKTGFALIISYGLVAETKSDYGDCGTNSCNQYISDRVCNEDTIGEDSQAPSDDFYRVGVLRSLSSGPETDFATMFAWEQALSDGLMSHVTDLDMLWIDSGSGISGGVQAGLCMRESGVNLVVGPSYSSVAQGASIIGTIYEKNVIGATSTSPLLSDTDSYSYFSRVIPSDNYQGAMLAEYAVNTQGWTKIATISISSEAYFEGITNVFAETAVLLGAQISEALRKIRASGVRVVMIAMEPARDALVIANATGMLDEGWAWLTTESTITTLTSNLWGLPEEKLVDMEKLLHGFIGLVPWMDTEGQTYQDWLSCVDSHYDDTTGMFANLGAMLTAANGNSVEVGKSKAKDMWYGYYYDAMMLALRALNPLTASERLDKRIARTVAIIWQHRVNDQSTRGTRYSGELDILVNVDELRNHN
ncbi:Hypothetical Protein FCC1311_027932 [Hondaea fermentalgiana]|uniref:Receptor ligand binding region domain-containing protein n=1 Tax=Hondaea fermentalgiana TaxID=2315210 RepID=A0A2R5G687_9STRA|nr:Hypothetical Protein FCC1311_027932 [Hondaea fermentalgiana]|eukprot:GBG26572.1 Hypothetical Protein FCC1311_027932 [Hondaea fermentalgiana]